MFQDVERYVDFIAKNSLSQPQFLFLYLIRRKKGEVIIKYKNAFPSGDDSMIGEIWKKDLVDRGFLVQVGEGTKMSDYEVTEKFNNIYLQDRWEALSELYEKYPGFVNIGGVDIPLTACDRYKLAILYVEAIDYSVDEHKEVILDVEYGRTNGLLRANIEKFINGKGWEKIRQLRLKQSTIRQLTEDNF